MTRISVKRVAQGVGALLLTLIFAGCASTAPGLDPVKGISAQQGDAVVIGKVRLIRNGKEVPLADDMLASTPKLHLTDLRHGRTIKAEVGENGEFAWPLQAEYYNISGIEFLVNGQKVLFPTYLTFAAGNDTKATYVGTITLETDIDSGYYGLSARAMSMSIANDCDRLCGRHLYDLGLDEDDLSIGLVRPDVALATADAR